MTVFIYIITCSVSGKSYVGKTSDPPKRFAQHMMGRGRHHLAKAVRAHGREAFKMAVLASCLDNDAACEAEMLLIVQWGTKKPSGYNLTDGGEGTFGYKATPETLALLSKIRRGTKMSLVTRERMAARMQAWVERDPEYWKNRGLVMANGTRGKKKPAEQVAKIQAARKATMDKRRAEGRVYDMSAANTVRAAAMRGKPMDPALHARMIAVKKSRRQADILIADQMRML